MSRKLKQQRKDDAENIKVIVRSRPLNQREIVVGMKGAVDLDLTEGTVTVNHLCGNPDRWTFDAVVNNTFAQRDVFVQFIQPMVDSVLDGFNATIFAYGQSGSGKTYTMTGGPEDLQGIIPRSFHYVFNHIKERRNANIAYTIRCSFLELYNGKIRDLLAKNQVTLNIKESKDKTFYVHDLSQPEVKYVQEMMQLMEEGTFRRQVAATELNTDSSRSHSIFTVCIEMVETTEEGDCRTVTSKLNLVDLAGSERQSKTRASGDTLKEGCNINLSLSALGTVIDTIVKGKGHIPFRSSPLTMLLKDSLGGNSKTCMFANINTADSNISETVSTLRFADRAKQIKNKPMVQMDAKDQKIQDLLQKVSDLQDKLKAYESNIAPNLEEEHELLQERVSTLEGEAEALRSELQHAQGDTEEASQMYEQKLLEVRKELEGKEEGVALLEDRLQLSHQAERDAMTECADLKDVVVGFLTEAHHEGSDPLDPVLKGDTRTIPTTDLKHFLDTLREGTVSPELLRVERDKHEAELEELRADLKQEAARLQEVASVAQASATAEGEKVAKLKSRLEREKESRRALVEETQAELQSLHKTLSEQRAQWDLERQQLAKACETAAKDDPTSVNGGAGIPAGHNGISEYNDSKAKAYAAQHVAAAHPQDADQQGLVAAKQEALKLAERIKALEAELAHHGKAESEVVSTAKAGMARARAGQEAAEVEASKILQRLAEPCEDDTAVVQRFKREIQLLDATLYQERDERAGLHRDVEGLRDALASEQRLRECENARLHELEAVQAKLQQLGSDGRESDHLQYVASLEAKVAMHEAGETHRQRQTQHYKGLEEHSMRVLEAVANTDYGNSDATQNLRAVIESLCTQLRPARSDAAAQHTNTEMTPKQQQLLNLQSKLNDLGNGAALRKSMDGDPSRITELEVRLSQTEGEVVLAQRESEASRAKLLAAQGRVADLETKLASPAKDDTQQVRDLKEELGCGVTEREQLRREVSTLTQRLSESRGAKPDEAHTDTVDNTVSLAHVHEQERELQELLEDKRDLEAEMEALRSCEDKHRQDVDELLLEKAAYNDSIFKLREELKRVTGQAAQEERVATKWKKERDAAVGSSTKMQQRLAEKEEVIKSMRAMNENQTQLLEKHRSLEQQLQADTQVLKSKLEETAASLSTRLQEEQAKWARYQSERLEAAQALQEKALAKKDAETEQVRKKLKKTQLSVQKVKERYDKQVLEAESLRAQLEDMKEEALRRLRDQQNPLVELDENRDEIKNIIRNSKAAHSRLLDNPDTEEKEKERSLKRRESVEHVKREEMRSAAARKFDEGNSFSASQQASAAARVRATGSISRYDSTSSAGRHYRTGSGSSATSALERRGSDLELGGSCHAPAPPQPQVSVPDNDTPGHGIHRQLSPRAQFNPTSRQREVEQRIMGIDIEQARAMEVQPRGPSTLNPFARLPSGAQRYSPEGSDSGAPQSTGLSMGLTSAACLGNQQQEPPNMSVPLPRKRDI